MNNIKTQFSIKDLENLSGIKAHTIRIWEKRYNLFEPKRTDTNIRYYDLKNLQKVLNISYLNRNGLKVSKIADLNSTEISHLVKEFALNKDNNSYCIDQFKLAMLNFDQQLFNAVYSELMKEHDFDFIFLEVFFPLLNDIGFLWQTDSITPAHEHFVVELIKQKLLLSTSEQSQSTVSDNYKTTYVLFLPENEIHELGLLYINYKLAEKGCHHIYLGQSVPLQSLEHLLTHFNKITFITSLTVMPEKPQIEAYLKTFNDTLLHGKNNNLIAFGYLTQSIESSSLAKNITLYDSTKDAVNSLIPLLETATTHD